MTNKQGFMGDAEIYLDYPYKKPLQYQQQSDGTMLYCHPQTGKMVPPSLLPQTLPKLERHT